MSALPLCFTLFLSAVRAEDGPARMLREAREHTKALIALDTSNPPGDELPAARYLKGVLDAEGVDSAIYASTGARASLVARIKGSGKKRPLLLMCHTDVVPADPKGWSTPPFLPVEKDGYLHGRGAADIKSMCAAEAAVLLRLKREKVALDRDVVFFAEADEETGSVVRHIDWLLKEHGPELDAEFAINEGGNSLWKDGRPAEILIQAAEKEYVDVHLTVRGPAGHSSVPRKDNAVAALAEAVSRLAALRFPAEVNDAARAFLEYRGHGAGEPLRSEIRGVLDAPPGRALDRAADRLAESSPELAAMLRDTVAPTVLKAGYKSNVIPSEASATLNARLLPGHAAEDLVAKLRSALEGLPVELSYEFSGRRPVGPMPVDNAFVRAVKETAGRLWPGVRVSPFMAVATTDSPDLRARGTLVYGLEPAFPDGDRDRMHGEDERILLAALDAYTEHLWEIVRALGVSL